MRKLLLVLALMNISYLLYAQVEEPKEEEKEITQHGFDKSKLFTGGNINLSFYNGATILGATPHIGYSLTKWLDAALSFNYTYISQRDQYANKQRQNLFAPGVFVRAFPVNFLFVHAQYEHSFVSQKFIPATGSSYAADKFKYQVNSFLVGPGYCSGRENGGNTYYYLSVLFDILEQPGSPYTDSYGRMIPFITAGFNIGLFQGRNRH